MSFQILCFFLRNIFGVFVLSWKVSSSNSILKRHLLYNVFFNPMYFSNIGLYINFCYKFERNLNLINSDLIISSFLNFADLKILYSLYACACEETERLCRDSRHAAHRCTEPIKIFPFSSAARAPPFVRSVACQESADDAVIVFTGRIKASQKPENFTAAFFRSFFFFLDRHFDARKKKRRRSCGLFPSCWEQTVQAEWGGGEGKCGRITDELSHHVCFYARFMLRLFTKCT